MNYADKIVRDTSRFDPVIERYDDGDICLIWSIPDELGVFSTLNAIGELTGLDDELFSFSSKQRTIHLHMPKEIAEACSQ